MSGYPAPGSFAAKLWAAVQPTMDRLGVVLIDSWHDERKQVWQFTFRDGEGRLERFRVAEEAMVNWTLEMLTRSFISSLCTLWDDWHIDDAVNITIATPLRMQSPPVEDGTNVTTASSVTHIAGQGWHAAKGGR